MKLFSLLTLGLILNACSTMSDSPSHIGSDTDDLKESPCRSCRGKPFYVNGQWVEARGEG